MRYETNGRTDGWLDVVVVSILQKKVGFGILHTHTTNTYTHAMLAAAEETGQPTTKHICVFGH